MSKGKLLITGGTGSFGSTYLKKAIENNQFDEIFVFSRDEKKQDDLRKTLNSSKINFYLGDVRDIESVTIKQDNQKSIQLLFDAQHSFEERILNEQFKF